MGPGVLEHKRRIRRDDVLGARTPQDALGQAAQPLPRGVVHAAEVVDDAGLGALVLGIPGVLGELVVGDGAAVGETALRLPQEHAHAIASRRLCCQEESAEPYTRNLGGFSRPTLAVTRTYARRRGLKVPRRVKVGSHGRIVERKYA
jgi:hypothetical protein